MLLITGQNVKLKNFNFLDNDLITFYKYQFEIQLVDNKQFFHLKGLKLIFSTKKKNVRTLLRQLISN